MRPRPRSRAALRWGFGIVSFVPSVAPRAPPSRSESPRQRVGRAPRAGAQAHAERDACGWPAGALGVRAPRAVAESAAAFMRRSPLGVWRRFVRPVRRPARAALSLRGPAPAGGRAVGRARGARVHRWWLSPPQSSRGVRATLVIFSCSLSPVVVLVSHFFCGRRFERSEGAAHARSDRRRARRARTPRVALAAAVEQGRSRAVFVFYSSSSLRVCRSARAAPSLHPRRRVARSPLRAGRVRSRLYIVCGVGNVAQ